MKMTVSRFAKQLFQVYSGQFADAHIVPSLSLSFRQRYLVLPLMFKIITVTERYTQRYPQIIWQPETKNGNSVPKSGSRQRERASISIRNTSRWSYLPGNYIHLLKKEYFPESIISCLLFLSSPVVGTNELSEAENEFRT